MCRIYGGKGNKRLDPTYRTPRYVRICIHGLGQAGIHISIPLGYALQGLHFSHRDSAWLSENGYGQVLMPKVTNESFTGGSGVIGNSNNIPA